MLKWFSESQYEPITKATFPAIFKELWEKKNNEHAVSGWRKTGLFPINKSAVDETISGGLTA